MREGYRSLHFPVLGVDVSNPAFDQRPFTTPIATNVRAYDCVTDRLRGGSRSGLTPFFGAGSTTQVSGLHLIQSLSTVVTADQAATPQNVFKNIQVKIDYSESDHPPTRNAPQVLTTNRWFQDTSPTFIGTSGVVVGTPDGGGTGMGTCSLKLTDDGTTVTLVATLLTLGLSWDFLSGPTQVQTLTESHANFFNPATSQLSSNWTGIHNSGGYIMNLFFNVFYNG